MALYIIDKNGEQIGQWHLDSKHVVLKGDVAADDIHHVIADGHELVYIIHNFKNIPNGRKIGIFTWYGDIAKTIVANL